MGTVSANLEIPASYLLRGGAHILLVGDSQTAATFFRYTNLLPSYIPKRLHYIVCPGDSTGGQCLWNHLPSNSGSFAATTHTGSGNAYTGLTAANTFFRTTQSQAISANLADAATYGSGFSLNRKNQSGADASSPGNTGGQWGDVDVGSGILKPFYHNTYMKAKILTHRVTAATEVSNYYMNLVRQGKDTNQSSGYTLANPTGTIIKESAWTSAFADRGDYDTTGVFPNDHDFIVRPSGVTAIDETGTNFLPMGAVMARCNAGGTLSTDTDAAGSAYAYGFDCVGVSGKSALDLYQDYQPQTTWQEYLQRSVLNPQGKTVAIFLLGHNSNSVDYSSGGNAATYANHYINYILKVKAAHDAAFPSGSFMPVLCVPWACTGGESNSLSSTAKGNAYQAACLGAATAAGIPFFSYYEYFNRVAPFNRLHPSSMAEVHRQCRALMHAMHDATNYEYMENAAAFRSRISVRTLASRQ